MTNADDETGRRANIVRAAAAVLARQGYSETSLKEIAAEADVAPGLLHYYFLSKEGLLLEVVMALQREMARDWREATRELDDPLERIISAIEHAAQRCSEHPEFFRLLFDLNMVSLTSPVIRERCREVWDRFVDDIETEMRNVLGKLPAYAVVAPRDLAFAIAGAIEGIALASIVKNHDSHGHYRALKALVLSLVATAYVQAGLEPPMDRLGGLLTSAGTPV